MKNPKLATVAAAFAIAVAFGLTRDLADEHAFDTARSDHPKMIYASASE